MPQIDTGQAVQVGIQGGAIAASAGLALAGSLALVPVVGLIAAPIALIASLVFNSANGQQKTASTSVVNQVEPLLQANLSTYLAGPRTAATQAAAVAYFDQAFALVTGSQGCGSQSLGDAGRKCIRDREPGGQWDWFKRYRDPIANDPTPAAASSTAIAAAQAANPGASPAQIAAIAAAAGSSSSLNPLYIVAAVAGAVLLLK